LRVAGVSMLALRVPMSMQLAATGLGIRGVLWTMTITSILSGLIRSISFALYSLLDSSKFAFGNFATL